MSEKGHVYQIRLTVSAFVWREENPVPVLEIFKRAITGEGEKAIRVYGSQVLKRQLDQLEVRASHREIAIKIWTRDEEKVTEYVKQAKIRASEELLKIISTVHILQNSLEKNPNVLKHDVNKNGVKNGTLTDIEITPDML